jgi:hypothetical protein
MDKVWVVTSGCYSDYGIRAIFSTKEKAWEYYGIKKVIDDEYNEPKEYNLDEAKSDGYIEAYKYDDDEWGFDGWENYMEEGMTEHTIIVKISFNYDKNVMAKSADDRLAFLKAQKEGIA